ncbi:hypothetical protein EV673_2484 [Limnobacter thiooxidans]|jgi:hypothetical protein|uniref:hypothetical protein n=1 Tax=Limnobacter thiooxidans TaxID=131080 RepID=UPI00102DDE87|nr:hypothetical protein EV673_2484 [Limnobacter thiooxidans]
MRFKFPTFIFSVIPVFLTLPASAQGEPCWQQHRATVHEWTCAGQSLPAEGKNFALSIVVVDSPKALLVIDSGATAAVGESAAKAIRSKFGTKPFWVLNSQPKPEHVLGNVGFRNVFKDTVVSGESFANRLVAGKRTADLMKARCPTCIENFSERMGGDSVKGTESLVPERVLKTQTGHLGVLQSDWVKWKYRLHKDLETEEALVLRNADLKLWWVGSALQNRDIPDLYDGNVIDRVNFLGRLKTQLKSDETVLTSFGALDAEWIDRNLHYFVQVHQTVLYGLEAGFSEVELIEQISADITRFKNPVLPETDPRANAQALETHQLNIQRIFHQTEPFAF